MPFGSIEVPYLLASFTVLFGKQLRSSYCLSLSGSASTSRVKRSDRNSLWTALLFRV